MYMYVCVYMCRTTPTNYDSDSRSTPPCKVPRFVRIFMHVRPYRSVAVPLRLQPEDQTILRRISLARSDMHKNLTPIRWCIMVGCHHMHHCLRDRTHGLLGADQHPQRNGRQSNSRSILLRSKSPDHIERATKRAAKQAVRAIKRTAQV